MTPAQAGILAAILVVAVAVVVVAWVRDVKRVQRLKNLRPGDRVNFYHGSRKLQGEITKRATTGAKIHCDQNGRNYAVTFDRIKPI